MEFESFAFSGARFYVEKAEAPLNQKGLIFFKGRNLDGMPVMSDGKKVSTSNGTGKTWFVQILEGFIFGKNARGQFKKSITPSFKGTLVFKDRKGDRWFFTWEPKAREAWIILKNDVPVHVSYKPSECQALLQTLIGITRHEWSYFVHLNQQSLKILIEGKPTERRLYLEGFFSIDEFYNLMFEKYSSTMKKQKSKAELIKENRIKLVEVKESMRTLPGEKWVRVQQEACDEGLALVKKNADELTKERVLLFGKIEGWTQYLSLFTELQGLDVQALKKERDVLVEDKVLLEEKNKKKVALETFVRTKLTPHENKKPEIKIEKPTQPAVLADEVSEKKIRLDKMREKLKLKKRLVPLSALLQELQAIAEKSLYNGMLDADLDKLKNVYYKEQEDFKEHLNLLNLGGDVCPTCKQSLGFILDGLSSEDKKAALKRQIIALDKKTSAVAALQTIRGRQVQVRQQHALLTEQFSQFPLFGLKLKDAEAELVEMQRQIKLWRNYNLEQEALTTWEYTKNLFLAEVKAMGYPELLEEDCSGDVAGANIRINALEEDIRRFDKLDDLTTAVMKWPSLPELEKSESLISEDLAVLTSRIENLTELRGALKEQLSSVVDLKEREADLQKKMENQKKIERECRILETVSLFYSPKGFKVYELKRRCSALIERANFWSKLFFQEAYEWSLSDDVDNLDFLVQPINDRSTEPYPIALFSSGEYNRAAHVLLFSQLELIPPIKKLNILFLDEIEGHLDEAGIVAFTDDVLPKLKETFTDRAIVLISHQNSILNSGIIDHLWVAERKHRQTKLTIFPWYQRRRSA